MITDVFVVQGYSVQKLLYCNDTWELTTEVTVSVKLGSLLGFYCHDDSSLADSTIRLVSFIVALYICSM